MIIIVYWVLDDPKKKRIEFRCRPSPVFWRFWSAKIQLRLASCQQQEVLRVTFVRTCIFAPMQKYFCSNAIVFVPQCYCICAPIQSYKCTNANVFVLQSYCICALIKWHLCTNAIVFVHPRICICETGAPLPWCTPPCAFLTWLQSAGFNAGAYRNLPPGCLSHFPAHVELPYNDLRQPERAWLVCRF